MIPIKSHPLLYGVVLVSLSMASCATLKTAELEKEEVNAERIPQTEAPAVFHTVKAQKIEEITERIKVDEERRDFQKVLQGWRQILSLDPENREAQRMVSQLEAGLQRAIAEHAKSGVAFYHQGEFEKSKKEFLLILFLDPGQIEAWRYLRRVSMLENTTVPQRPRFFEAPEPSGEYILHPVREGETLSMIAEEYWGDRSKSQMIADANAISDAARVRAGRIIKIPLLKGGASQTTNGAKPAMAAGEQEQTGSPGPTPMKSMSTEDVFKQRLNRAKKLYQENEIMEASAEFQEMTRQRPDQKEAVDYLERSRTIINGVKSAASFETAKEYEAAYDEFQRILVVKPDFTPAVDRVRDLMPLLIAKAGDLLHEEQSPCEAIVLTKKILQRSPNNIDAKILLDESSEIGRSLELQC